MKPTVVLFDIDGTLVSTGGAGRRAIERGFDTAFGKPNACSGFSFDGMTDRAIVRLGLEAIGVEAAEHHIDAVLSAYVKALGEEVAKATYDPHVGTRHAVQRCADAGFAVGLGTGNIREGARLKLERVGLFSPFAFGGFGDDHELRPELIRIGAERGVKHLGVEWSAVRVVVIGDTPKDISAAQAIGAECLAVATGGHSVVQLQGAGATLAVADLTSSAALDFMLGS